MSWFAAKKHAGIGVGIGIGYTALHYYLRHFGPISPSSSVSSIAQQNPVAISLIMSEPRICEWESPRNHRNERTPNSSSLRMPTINLLDDGFVLCPVDCIDVILP